MQQTEPPAQESDEGETLREFLAAFCQEYDVRDMLIAETESEATTEGWAPELGGLPGENYAKTPRASRPGSTPA